MALGGCNYGISPLEMAGAYATIANNGVYIEPTFYTKVEDSTGNIVIEAEQNKNRKSYVRTTCLYIKNLLKQPVEGTGGTATVCRISGRFDVGAKTGTTKDVMIDGYVDLHHIIQLQHGLDMMIMKKFTILETLQEK